MTDKTKVPQTLLLADDSVTIQRVIELTFADEDINVVAVSDGDQAIARIDADPPDIVLVDVGMPGRSGYEVAEHVKHEPGLHHIPVVLLTGAFEPVDHERAAESGCDGVLAKPFEPQQVISRVKELLARSASDHLEQPLAGATVETPRVERMPASEVARLDSYFAQLDEAFATLSDPRSAQAPSADADSSASLSIDWYGAPPAPSPDLPLSSVPAREEHLELPTPRPDQSGPADERAQGPVALLTAPPTPRLEPDEVSLADAFVEMLAEEEHQPTPETAPAWSAPAWSAPAPPPPAVEAAVSEETVEAITERVLERLSDRVVRETVTSLVSDIAERLVREEIERIKASIQ